MPARRADSGTVPPVRDFKGQLLAALDTYTEEPLVSLLDGILGPRSIKDYAIDGYFLTSENGILRLFVLSGPRFVLFEIDATSNYMIVAIPLARISRVEERLIRTPRPGVTETDVFTQLLVEFDADLVRTSSGGEISAIVRPNDREGALPGEMLFLGNLGSVDTTNRARYTALTPVSDVPLTALLRDFAKALRAAL